MSAQITTVADALGVPAADVAAIIRGLSNADYADTADHDADVNRDRYDVVELPDGTTAPNIYLTPEAIVSLFDEFGGDPDVLADTFGIHRPAKDG